MSELNEYTYSELDNGITTIRPIKKLNKYKPIEKLHKTKRLRKSRTLDFLRRQAARKRLNALRKVESKLDEAMECVEE